MITASFSGLAETLARLRPINKARLKGKIHGHAAAIVADMQAGVPVDTEALRDSIRMETTSDGVQIVAGGDATTRAYGGRAGYAREVKVGQGDTAGIARGSAAVTYDYAMAVEFGTQETPAQPFFWPAAREHLPDIRADLSAEATRQIEQGGE